MLVLTDTWMTPQEQYGDMLCFFCCFIMLGHGFWWTKFGLHVQAWKLHVEFGVLLSKGTQFPRSLSITQRCENRQETQVSTTIGHPEPHDLWGHRANIRHVLPFFTLFPPLFPQTSPREEHTGSSRTLSEGQGLLSLSPASQLGFSPPLFSSNSSWRRVAAFSSAHQGNLLATQALSSSKLRLDVQQENLNQPLSCTTQQKPARRFHTTSNGTATTPSSTFQGR